MTAYVNIPVATATDVVKVPNGALRYKPDLTAPDMTALLQKYGIAAGGGRGGKNGQGQSTTVAVVWKLDANKTLEPVQLKLGITDHTTTEVAQVMKGSLNAGDAVITGSAASTQATSGTSAPGLGNTRGAAGGMRGIGR
jgi:HlyD family secretion protein